ncbi:ABC transporter substrate-binding protein [Microbacterium sp. SLBN-146]|uniref:ABC transporter substrate-binding protein n=1 Tax=Microbacterium sp. SLBN-146 TaxID=2768457 RepID=UPI0011513457|nr:ABC transporter substrate-binding protein [Microbacterium sp. SLBN-146]TQJ30739.1 ABC-type nitrate/sulfonate/bicarbonate transport system substrate-binding protein [Microbacterium sp. SLBN-146]
MKLRKSLALVVATGLLFGTAACSSGSSEPAASGSGEPDQVAVNSLNIVGMGPLFIAEEKGFFEEQGIENSYTDADIYAQMAVQSQGNVDVNIPGLGGAFFNAINQNLNLVAVADRNQYTCTADSLLVVRTEQYDAGIDSVAELAGKNVAILARGSSTEYWLSRALAEEGLTIDDLGALTTLGYPDIANALKTGAVDAGFLAQPIGYGVLADGTAKRLLATYEIVPDEQQGLITMSTKFIEERGDVATRWMVAWLEGVRYYMDPANRDEVVQIIAESTSVPVETVDALYGTDQWPYMNPNGEVDTETAMNEDGAWLVENGIVESLPAVDKWYDESVVASALEIVGEVDNERTCSDVTRLDVP